MNLFNQMNAIADKNNAHSANQAQLQMNFQKQESEKMREFNRTEAKVNRDWQEMMSNTAHQREVEDLKKAGLNPVLSMGGQGASSGTGASASQSSSSQGAKGDTDMSVVSALAALASASINSSAMVNAAAMSANASMHNAQVSAQAQNNASYRQFKSSFFNTLSNAFNNRYTANKHYQASKYSADNYLKGSVISAISSTIGSMFK